MPVHLWLGDGYHGLLIFGLIINLRQAILLSNRKVACMFLIRSRDCVKGEALGENLGLLQVPIFVVMELFGVAFASRVTNMYFTGYEKLFLSRHMDAHTSGQDGLS